MFFCFICCEVTEGWGGRGVVCGRRVLVDIGRRRSSGVFPTNLVEDLHSLDLLSAPADPSVVAAQATGCYRHCEHRRKRGKRSGIQARIEAGSMRTASWSNTVSVERLGQRHYLRLYPGASQPNTALLRHQDKPGIACRDTKDTNSWSWTNAISCRCTLCCVESR